MPVYTEPAFIAFPSLSAVAEMRRARRSGCFPCAMADRSGRSRCPTTTSSSSSSSSGGGIRRGGGLGGEGRLDLRPPTVIATGCWGGSIGTDDAEDGPATCEADACIDATSWRCRSLFAAESNRGGVERMRRPGGGEPDREMRCAQSPCFEFDSVVK